MSEVVDFALKAWPKSQAFRIQDAYKWLFHATRGGEHAIRDPEVPKGWLDREWPTLSEPLPEELLWEPLRPDGSLGRLNLRPYRARGGQPDPLLAAFIRSANQFKSERKDFEQAWTALGDRLRASPVNGLFFADWADFDRQMRPRGYPAVHHSPAYEAAHRPAYRVLTRLEMESLLRLLDDDGTAPSSTGPDPNPSPTSSAN